MNQKTITDVAGNPKYLTTELCGVRNVICLMSEAGNFETFVTDDTFFAPSQSVRRLAEEYTAQIERLTEAGKGTEAAA